MSSQNNPSGIESNPDHPHLAWMKDEISTEVTKQGGNGGGGNMIELEKRVRAIETDVAVIKSNYATKADISDLRTEISKEIHTQTRWLIATVLTVVTAVIAMQRLTPMQAPANPAATISQPSTK